ncbi:MAG: MFS transporter [Desulfobacterales bacterium]
MNPAAGFKPIYLRVFFPFALGYFISFLFRVVNAVIGPDLTAALSLGPDDLGLLTAAYFITFAAAQLPLGILLDRFGPRRIEAALLLIAAAGAVIFSQAQSLAGLVIGRGLIGLGVSACLMAAFTAYARWFPAARLPLINSFQMTAGGLGVLTATTPVQAALKVTDWRGIFLLLAAITLAAAIGIIAVVPRRQAVGTQIRLSDQLRGTLEILKTPLFWQIVPWATLSQASMMSLQGLWTGPWLRDVAGLGRDQSARVLMGMALGMVAGYLAMGFISDRLGRRAIPPRRVAAWGMALFLVTQGMILWVPLIPTWLVWIAFTFFGTSGILCYADLSQRFPTHMTGRANTALNLLVFIAAFALQWGIGVVLDQWPRTPQGGYAPQGYQVAFTILWLLQLAGAGWFLIASRGQGRARPR